MRVLFRKTLKYLLIYLLIVVVVDPFMRHSVGTNYDRALLKLRHVAQRIWSGVGRNMAFARNRVTGFSTTVPEDLDTQHARQQVVRTARSFLGTTYQFGGESQLGVDCSGLVVQAYRSVGIELPRRARKQHRWVRSISYKELQPGDLVFFRGASRRVSHVGIYLGQNKVLHASSSRQRVVIDPMVVAAMNNKVVGFGSVFLK